MLSYVELQIIDSCKVGCHSQCKATLCVLPSFWHGASNTLVCHFSLLLLSLCCVTFPGDRPTDVTQRRLANSISGASGSRLAAALGLLATGVITASTHVIPDVEAAAAAVTGSAAAGDAGIVAAAAAAAGALALAWPVLSPFAEVWQFSRLEGQQVEDTVAIKQPLQVR